VSGLEELDVTDLLAQSAVTRACMSKHLFVSLESIIKYLRNIIYLLCITY